MDSTEGVSLTDGQYAALVDFVYNVGSANFRQSTLLRCVKARNYPRIKQEFPRWVHAGGRVWPGLEKRRQAEIALFFEGVEIPPATSLRETAPPPPIDIRIGEADAVVEGAVRASGVDGDC
jgi:hypothetical protein